MMSRRARRGAVLSVVLGVITVVERNIYSTICELLGRLLNFHFGLPKDRTQLRLHFGLPILRIFDKDPNVQNSQNKSLRYRTELQNYRILLMLVCCQQNTVPSS